MPSDLAEVRVWRLGLATRIMAGLLIGGMAVVVVVFFFWQATAPDGNLLAPLAIGALTACSDSPCGGETSILGCPPARRG
ncbi:hypothetical protein GA0070609_4024 [Micromonospora echinaurantiaca]|uniref:Uncharacterized protein n=1 Tax=Micromonospora echinaurantiaca TaxID=47857 RepID=A0A1C5J3E5_9ACTN|nr:hypothetical protein [Micromonospora echinaurantiaca]SCG65148.1 hypothetical protein GA0070609_4024 [Micromonospora echinaurantiaca]